jgi:hypothetical protein
MRELLSKDGIGLVLLGAIQRDVQSMKDALSIQDLRIAEGVQNALEMQGQIKGLNRVIDIIFDIAENENG